jgi:hypothetical protein
VQGRVRDVLLRGHRAVAGGDLVDDLPPGRFLPCALPDPSVS